MAIWSTLYAVRDDSGLEATGLRAVFDGMADLLTAPSGFERFMVRKADDSGWEPFQVRTADDSGWEDFQVSNNG
jgi:hypothetical protein